VRLRGATAERTVRFTAVPVPDGAGRLAAVVVSFQDVSVEKRARQRVQDLNEHLEKMAVEHPWSAELTEQEIDWLSSVARDEFRGLKQPIQAGNPIDTLRLRQRVAELSDVFGPHWYPHKQVAAGPTQQTAPPANGGQQRTPASNNRPVNTANVRETARLANVAVHQPPSLNSAGHADNGEAAITSDRISAMSEDEILALPRQVRDRYLYGG